MSDQPDTPAACRDCNAEAPAQVCASCAEESTAKAIAGILQSVPLKLAKQIAPLIDERIAQFVAAQLTADADALTSVARADARDIEQGYSEVKDYEADDSARAARKGRELAAVVAKLAGEPIHYDIGDDIACADDEPETIAITIAITTDVYRATCAKCRHSAAAALEALRFVAVPQQRS